MDGANNNLRAALTARTEEMVALTRDLVTLESPTTDKQAVDQLGARIAEELAARDADITVHARETVGNIVEARWHADRPGKPMLIVCHMDTVHPLGAMEENPLRVENGRLYGPGAYDMKGSIAAVLGALDTLLDADHLPERPITLLVTSDEETGSFHSRDLIQQRAADAALALIMEAALPDGSLKTWRKSVARFRVRTHGYAAHAGGAHEAGLNAVEEMAHQVINLQRMTNYKVGTTVNVGVIHGGTRTNVVPDTCDAWVDVRSLTSDEMARITKLIEGIQPVLPGARVEVEGGFDRPPMERDDRMVATFEQAKAIAARHGLTLRESGTGGASDGNYTAAIGTPTLDGLGPLGDGAHSSREHLLINSLPRSATLVASLLLDWPRE